MLCFFFTFYILIQTPLGVVFAHLYLTYTWVRVLVVNVQFVDLWETEVSCVAVHRCQHPTCHSTSSPETPFPSLQHDWNANTQS